MISVSYNYSSNDFEFLEESIKQSKLVTDDIHFSSVSKFFDGSDENENLIKKSIEICKSNGVHFHQIPFNENIKNHIPNQKYFFKYWHDISRLVNASKSKYDYVIFLDGDEIIDGVNFKNWASSVNLTDCNSYVFNVYWYFRNKKYQATTWEEGPVMANKNSLYEEDLMNISERWALLKDPCVRQVNSIDGIPMLHHYSWAKGNSEKECEEMLLKKVKSWGHTLDRDWASLIKEEFSRPFNGKDFIHGYSYNML